MLQNWLKPINLDQCDFKALNAAQFGRRIKIHRNLLPKLKLARIAIIGIDEVEANAVRKALYRLSFPFKGLKVVDLGNLRNNKVNFLVPVIKELLDGQIIPILIGKQPDFTLAQYRAYHIQKHLINMAIVDQRIPFDTRFKSDDNYLHKILDLKNNHLFHLNMLGYQSHYTHKHQITAMHKRNFDCIRVGQVQSDISAVEPYIRDADALSFNIAAIRHAEAPGQINPSPAGFFLEEACRICRYAGMSDKLTSVGFYGYDHATNLIEKDNPIMALLAWYFIEGFYQRKNDYPSSVDHMTEYIVSFKDNDFDLTFWKSEKSGRWWMQVPVKTKKKIKRHRLLPCSYQDYLLACKEDLPDRLVQATKRYENY